MKSRTIVLWLLMSWSLVVPAHYVFSQGHPINITSSALLIWDATPDQGSLTYTVKRSLVHLGPYTTIASGVIGDLYSNPDQGRFGLSYTDNTVKPKTTYYYVIMATNTIGDSPDSDEATVIIP